MTLSELFVVRHFLDEILDRTDDMLDVSEKDALMALHDRISRALEARGIAVETQM
jgi:hypothetical protein